MNYDGSQTLVIIIASAQIMHDRPQTAVDFNSKSVSAVKYRYLK